jgi:cytochrome c-type biogenesis protein CcmH
MITTFFWLLLALMAFLAVLPLMMAMRKQGSGNSLVDQGKDHFYQDQFLQLQKDTGLGLVSAGDKTGLEKEIARRMLAAPSVSSAMKDKPFFSAISGMILAMAFALSALSLYMWLGEPDWRYLQKTMPEKPVSSQNLPVNDLVAKVEAALARNPDDARGWRVLLPVYMRQGQWNKAEAALNQLTRLEGPKPEWQALQTELQQLRAQPPLRPDQPPLK